MHRLIHIQIVFICMYFFSVNNNVNDNMNKHAHYKLMQRYLRLI